MQNANRRLDKIGKKFQTVGAGLTAGLTLPIAALGVSSVNAFDKQAKAIAQVEAGLKSTQGQVGLTSAELQKMASDLQNTSLFGDEEILKDVTAQLLTFTNITGSAFNRTQQAALDLSTRLDGDLKSSAIQLGKALNDPVANLSALSRSGIQFSNAQKETINALVSTNQMAEAQTLILDELEKQYGGSAAAAAKAGKGPLTQLGNTLGDISEEFGAIILEGINPFVDKLKGIAQSFQNLSPQTKKWIVILGGVAAAAGPLLALAGTILPAIGTGLALLTGPIALIIAGLTAVGVVIYKNWAPIKKTLIDIANYFVDLYNESTVFRIAVEAVVAQFKIMWEVGKFVFEGIKSLLLGFVDSFKSGFSTVGKIFKAVLTGNFEALPGIIKKASGESLNNFSKLTDNLAKDWEGLLDGIQKVATNGLDNIKSRKKIDLIIDVNTDDKIDDIIDLPKGRASATSVNSGLGEGGSLLTVSPLAGIASSIPEERKVIDQNLLAFQERLAEFNSVSSQIMQGVAENFVEGFANVVAGLASGAVGFGAVGGLILSTIADLAIQLGKAAIKIGITMKAIQLSFSSPLAAIAAGAGLLVVGQLLKGLAGNFGGGGGYAGAFAEGGIVGGSSFYGDKLLARVNSGELILNQDQQRNLYGMINNAGDVVTRTEQIIRGDKLILVTERAKRKSNRIS